MSIRHDRLKESIHIIASEELLSHTREYEHDHGLITILEVDLSPDNLLAQIYVSGGDDHKGLLKFVAPLASRIHGRVSREYGLRKAPKIMFKIAKKRLEKKDILTLIQELDEQYGLSK